MKGKIYELIKDLKSVSFVNLCEKIDGFKGDMAMVHGKNEHIIYWPGVSVEAMNAINALMKEKLIEMNPTPPLTYMVDGMMLNLPTVTGNYDYKTDHWLPVVFDVYGTWDDRKKKRKRK